MIPVFNQIAQLRAQVTSWKKAGLTVAFVPTMGNLHDGHISLVALAKKSADKVVVSVFVNPLQFGENEDFNEYPRTFNADVDKLSGALADAVFYPNEAEMYPNGRTAQTLVSAPSDLTSRLEGKTRPGHFDGVTTVVAKLFNIVQPDSAVFGLKDFQQLSIIKRMTADLCLPINIISAPIARANDGLALSSRNQYLNPSQRAIAPILYQTLQSCIIEIQQQPLQVGEILAKAEKQLLGAGFDQVDYLKLVDTDSLIEFEAMYPSEIETVLLVVARLGKTRLLDNVVIKPNRA